MSLINQMLRDLQKRQDDSPSVERVESASSVSRKQRLPAPLLAGVLGLFGLMLLWWLAGALSGLFLPDPVVKSTPVLEPVAIASKEPVEAKPVLPVEPSAEQTAMETQVSVEPSVVATLSPVPEVSTPQIAQPKSPPAPTPAPVRKIVKKKPKPRPRVAAPRIVKAVTPAPPVRSLHPDELPGAILNASRTLVSSPSMVSRPLPRRSEATPFGAAETAFNEGMQAYLTNRNTRAIASLQKALDLYPGHLAARELLVDIYELTGRSGQAMHLLAEGLAIAPDYMPFKKRYARLLIDQGDLPAAVAALLHDGMPAIDRDPEAHVLLASLYQRLGESFLAAQTYRNLLVVWPQTGAFWIGLGSALEDQGLPGEARKAYEQALATHNLRKDLVAHVQARLSRS
jgi:MSHA biogenesis protein MshN